MSDSIAPTGRDRLIASFEKQQEPVAKLGRKALLALFSALSIQPINPETGQPFTAEELGQLRKRQLRILLLNCPVNPAARLAKGGLTGFARVVEALEKQNAQRETS